MGDLGTRAHFVHHDALERSKLDQIRVALGNAPVVAVVHLRREQKLSGPVPESVVLIG